MRAREREIEADDYLEEAEMIMDETIPYFLYPHDQDYFSRVCDTTFKLISHA